MFLYFLVNVETLKSTTPHVLETPENFESLLSKDQSLITLHNFFCFLIGLIKHQELSHLWTKLGECNSLMRANVIFMERHFCTLLIFEVKMILLQV